MPDVDQGTLHGFLSDIAAKQWVYGDPETSEATRVQFPSAIFERVVHMFRHAPGYRVALHVQPKLSGAYVQVNGIVDFLITRGGKNVCIVEAKNWNFKKASAQNVLGMEVAVDNSNEECAYGIVTNYIEWKFLKRTDEGIERFCDGINHHGSSREEDIKRVASRLCAIIQALN